MSMTLHLSQFLSSKTYISINRHGNEKFFNYNVLFKKEVIMKTKKIKKKLEINKKTIALLMIQVETGDVKGGVGIQTTLQGTCPEPCEVACCLIY